MIEEKELHYFPVKIMEYTDPGWTPEWCEEFKAWGREFPANQSNFPEGVITSKTDMHKQDAPCVQRVVKFFNECLAQYKERFELNCDQLEISIAWFNHAPSQSGWGHPLHRHPMSYVSSVYYITEGAPTIFGDPCTPRTSDTLDVWQDTLMKSDGWNLGINEMYQSNPGKLIIFPSWLHHFSGRQLQDFDRWTISFNALPTGKVNTGPYGLPQVNLKLL